jgi:multidrug resistance efflux pump
VERPKIILRLAMLVAAAAAVWWWRYGRGPEVAAVAAWRGTAVEIVYATGGPVRWAKVTSLIRRRIVEFCDCEGKVVAKGDVLVRLDDREQRAQLQELKAREDFAKREVARVTELIGRGSATTQAHERVSTDLRTIQALISVQMEKLDNYTITAPMDGVVLRRDGEVGEIVDPGQVLYRVGVPKPLQVVAEVNEDDIPRVAVGQMVLLRSDAFAGKQLDGKQRVVAVARALANEPPLILADEPTGPLDSKSSEQVFLILRDLVDRHAKTVVAVTHDLTLAARMHRRIQLADGAIVTDDGGIIG